MAQTLVPHLVNDKGVGRIRIGVKEFQCMGATAEIVCPYCSTVYEHDRALKATESDPPLCVFVATAPPGAPAA